MLSKLQKLGFDDVRIYWFTSYLGYRQHINTVGSLYNDYCGFNDYVATQGTSLVPILFLIFINSIPASVLKGKIIMFADDIAIFNNDDSWENEKKMSCLTYSRFMYYYVLLILLLNRLYYFMIFFFRFFL